MQTRKMKIIVSGKDGLLALLEEIKTVGEVTIELEVEDTKQTYSVLTHSPHVKDWDFTAEESERNYMTVGMSGTGRNDATETSSPDFLTLTSSTKTDGILKNIPENNWNELAWRIEAIWRSAQKSPAVIFQSGFFWEVVEKNNQKSVTPEHAILTKLGEARYSGWNWEDANQDLTEILNDVWKKKQAEGKSLAEFSRLIYGGQR